MSERDLTNHLERIDSMIENAEYDEAIEDLERLRIKYDRDYRIKYYLGSAYLSKKNMSDA